jgi:hypothetical protein
LPKLVSHCQDEHLASRAEPLDRKNFRLPEENTQRVFEQFDKAILA